MIKFKGNWLLWQLVIIYGMFILGGLFIVPGPYMSSGTAIMALIAGGLMAWRYSAKAGEILFQELRGAYGAHNAILGAAELAIGLVYSGMYRLAYIHYHQPESWKVSIWGALGLFAIAKGAFRLAVSPDEVSPGNHFPEGFWMVALWCAAIIVAFIAGTNFASLGQ